MQRISEEYENYEPEISIWPYVLLGFLVPSVPFLSFLLMEKHGLASTGLIWNIAQMVPIAASCFITAYAVRTSRGSVLYPVTGAFHFLIMLMRWGSLGGNTAFPLGLMVSPSFIPLLLYAYYAKRKRLPAYAAVLIFSIISLGLVILYFALSLKPSGTAALICYSFPSLALFIAIMTFAVTRRMENTPWFIAVPLSLLCILSLFTGDDFIRSSGSIRSLLFYMLKESVSGYGFWFMITMVIAYQGMSHKSYFRNIGIPVKDDESTEEETVFYEDSRRAGISPDDYRTAFPPRVSRFEKDDRPSYPYERETERPRYRDDEYEERRCRRPRYRDCDDDYYYDERPYRGHMRRDDYEDAYYREREPERLRDDEYRERRRPDEGRNCRRYIQHDEEHRPVRDLDYDDDPDSRYDRWYELIKGENPPDSRR